MLTQEHVRRDEGRCIRCDKPIMSPEHDSRRFCWHYWRLTEAGCDTEADERAVDMSEARPISSISNEANSESHIVNSICKCAKPEDRELTLAARYSKAYTHVRRHIRKAATLDYAYIEANIDEIEGIATHHAIAMAELGSCVYIAFDDGSIVGHLDEESLFEVMPQTDRNRIATRLRYPSGTVGAHIQRNVSRFMNDSDKGPKGLSPKAQILMAFLERTAKERVWTLSRRYWRSRIKAWHRSTHHSTYYWSFRNVMTALDTEWFVERELAHHADIQANTQLRSDSRKYLQEIGEAQGWKCTYCESNVSIPGPGVARVDTVELDHKIPISRGGTGMLDNLQVLCWWCNNSKRAMTHEEYITELQRCERLRATRKAELETIYPAEVWLGRSFIKDANGRIHTEELWRLARQSEGGTDESKPWGMDRRKFTRIVRKLFLLEPVSGFRIDGKTENGLQGIRPRTSDDPPLERCILCGWMFGLYDILVGGSGRYVQSYPRGGQTDSLVYAHILCQVCWEQHRRCRRRRCRRMKTG